MTGRRPTLTAARARELLIYNRATGVFRWRVDRKGGKGSVKCHAGDIAGGIDKVHGYRTIVIDGNKYQAARLAFLIVLGRWPNPEADHENNKRDDNRWTNLREATRSQQSMNRPARKDSVNGLKGVVRRPNGKFQARIMAHLGTYNTATAANLAWKRAAILLHGEFFNAKRHGSART